MIVVGPVAGRPRPRFSSCIVATCQKKSGDRIKRKMPSRKGVKIPSRLPVKIPDNKHYLEFLVSRAGKQRVPGRVCRSRCAGNNYQRRSAAFVPLSPQRQLVGFDRFPGQPRLFSPYFVRLNRRFWAGADSLPDKRRYTLFGVVLGDGSAQYRAG